MAASFLAPGGLLGLLEALPSRTCHGRSSPSSSRSRRRTASNSRVEPNVARRPDVMCSTRPENSRGRAPVSRLNCTTKAFQTGSVGTLARLALLADDDGRSAGVRRDFTRRDSRRTTAGVVKVLAKFEQILRKDPHPGARRAGQALES